MKKINVVIYGATGSIGTSTLSVIRKNKKYFNLEAVSCNKNIKSIKKIANEFNVKKIGYNETKIKGNQKNILKKCETFNDISLFSKMISKETDVIIFAISGLYGIDLLLDILKSGKKIGIANKECIISLGKNLNNLAKKFVTEIIPLDSEHNSIYQLIKQTDKKFESITLTASGGPFINYKLKDLKAVTLKETIKHPIWNMGKKISIDSANMMNKALEIIEAKYLFNLKDSQIKTVIHPQAIIHAFLNYSNGSSTALLSDPDMRIPIFSIFNLGGHYNGSGKEFEFSKYSNLEFMPVDNKKFPAINLAYEVLKVGGLAPNVFNYLNDYFVKFFIAGRINFVDIVKLNRKYIEITFNKNKNISNPTISDIKNINNWIHYYLKNEKKF